MSSFNPMDNKNAYELLLDNIHGFVIIKDREHRILWLNSNARDFFSKRGISDPIGLKYIGDISCDTESGEKLNKIDSEIFQTGKSHLGIPLIGKCIENETRPVLYRIDKIPYRDSSGNVEGVITFMLDTTHALELQIKKYIDDVTFHELRAQLGNIIKNITPKIS